MNRTVWLSGHLVRLSQGAQAGGTVRQHFYGGNHLCEPFKLNGFNSNIHRLLRPVGSINGHVPEAQQGPMVSNDGDGGHSRIVFEPTHCQHYGPHLPVEGRSSLLRVCEGLAGGEAIPLSQPWSSCASTAPTESSEASVYTLKGRVKLGSVTTGEDVRICLR